MNKTTAIIFLVMAFSSPCRGQQIAPQCVSQTEGLSFPELAKTALSRNKDLEAARASLRQAEARSTQARIRPNPTLDVSQSTDVMFGNEGDNTFFLTVSQTLELGGKRPKRMKVEATAIEVSKAEIADRERQVVARLRSLYVDAIGEATRLNLFDRLDKLNQQTVSILEVRLKAGDASRLDSRLLAAQTNQVRAQRLAAENQLTGTLLQIRVLVGFSDKEALVLHRNDSFADVHETEQQIVLEALENRPDLKAAKLREELAEAGITLAKSQAVPNVTAFAGYGRESVPILAANGSLRSFERDNVMQFGASLPLPFFNREQGNVAEAASKRTQARSEREALEQTVQREVLIAYRRYQTARQTLAIMQASVIEPMEESTRIVQLAYNLGDMRILDVVNQQRTLLEAETSYVDAQTELNAAYADLQAAMGVTNQ